MKLLSIDSSTPLLSVALLEQEKIQSEQSKEHSPPEPNPVLAMVDSVLSEANSSLQDVDGFVLTIGPGSFTGLRVGLSLVKGFVLATEKPALGVSSLQAWACRAQGTASQVCSLLDARKGEVYYALFQKSGQGLNRAGTEKILSPQAVLEHIQEPTEFVGSGVHRYRDFFLENLGNRFLTTPEKATPTVAGLAGQIALPDFKAKADVDLSRLTLQYLRKPEAEVNYEKR